MLKHVLAIGWASVHPSVFRARLNTGWLSMLRTAGGRAVPYVWTTSREGAFTKLGLCPFHDGCSGMRRPELTSLRVCRVECNQIRRTSIMYGASTSRSWRWCGTWRAAIATAVVLEYNMQPPITIEHKSINRILNTLERRQGRHTQQYRNSQLVCAYSCYCSSF